VVDLAVPPLEESGVPGLLRAANGFLSVSDPVPMLQGLERLSSDDALAARMGTSGRQFVSSVYAQERLKREITALYDELVKSLGLAKQEVSASPRHAGV
jgi:glycosyltransferase involved in cell wall biosynthesis